MRIELICHNGSLPKQKIVLGDLPVIIGRNPDFGIYLNDSQVSRSHCVIALDKGKLVVRDLESEHGTFVNGSPIKEVYLVPGDELTLGTTHFVVDFELDAPTPPDFGECGTVRVATENPP